LFLRGLSFNIGPATAGVEMVADYIKKEVGPFFYGGADVGTNTVGAGVSVYTGFGYKGNSANTVLYDAYKGWFNSIYGGVAIPIPFFPAVSAGIGGLLSVTAASATPIVSATCREVITLAATFGVSVSLANLRFSAGATATYYVSRPALFQQCGSSWVPRLCMGFRIALMGLPSETVMGLAILALHSVSW